MNYFTLQEQLGKQYYAIPKALLQEGKYKNMSRDSKFLYSILLDRYNISNKNVSEGNVSWLDDKGRIYFVYEQESLSELFGASEKTLRKYINELIKYELLETKRMGLGMANRYYLKKPIIKDMLENYKNKKASTAGTEEASENKTNCNNNICNDYKDNTSNKEKNKQANNVKEDSEVVKLLKDNKITGVKATEAEKLFIDTNILTNAIEECISRNKKSYGYLKMVYETKIEESNTKSNANYSNTKPGNSKSSVYMASTKVMLSDGTVVDSSALDNKMIELKGDFKHGTNNSGLNPNLEKGNYKDYIREYDPKSRTLISNKF